MRKWTGRVLLGILGLWFAGAVVAALNSDWPPDGIWAYAGATIRLLIAGGWWSVGAACLIVPLWFWGVSAQTRRMLSQGS